MPELPDQLMNSVLGKIYDTLAMGGPSTNKTIGLNNVGDQDTQHIKRSNDFFAWVTPSIPYPEEDLDFLAQGFTPSFRKEEGEPDLTDAEISQKLGADAVKLYNQAQALSYLVDFIPDASDVRDGDRNMTTVTQVWNPSNRLSQMYKFVLDASQVIQTPADPEKEERIEKLRGILEEMVEEEDIDLNGNIVMREVPRETHRAKMYGEYMLAYIAEAMSYNNIRLAANAGDLKAIQNVAINGILYKQKIRKAYNDWVGRGSKSIIEKVNAAIRQLTGTDLNLIKQGLLEDFDETIVTNPSDNSEFQITKLLPPSFASTTWNTFTWSSSEYNHHYDRTKTKWGAGAKFLGKFSIGGSAGREEEEINKDIEWDTFSLSFEIAQIPIMRPWFRPEFLTSRYWRFGPDAKILDPSDGEVPLSDGAVPPTGRAPAYTTAIIFVRNLKLNFKTKSGNYDRISSKFNAGGSVSVGPFSFGGKYKKDKVESDFHSETTAEGIYAPGMQVIGFRCHLLGKSPNPIQENLPDIQYA